MHISMHHCLARLLYIKPSFTIHSASHTSKSRLQNLQTTAAKLISGSGPKANINPIYKSLDWLSLQHRRDFHKCIFV